MIPRKSKCVILIAVVLLVGTAAVVRWQGRAMIPRTQYENAYTDVAPILEGIYAADRDAASAGPVGELGALVVPHHMTASTAIARGIKQIQNQPIKKILLLSPDHFFGCSTLLCTTDSTYETFFGQVNADTSVVRKLLDSSIVSSAPELFRQEHGIFTVLPFIKYYAPDASVTPLVISQKWQWKSSQEELLALMDSVVDEETLLVLSSDFSHYLPLGQADALDVQTQSAIEAIDLEAIADLVNPDQSDCPNGLWLVAAFAKERGFDHPTVLAHTNSARILDEPYVASTTSHFAIAWIK